MNISICIATYRRPHQLRALLGDLAVQTRVPAELVLIDNDAVGSARTVVGQAVAEGLPFPVRYAIQPVKNIALSRNDSVRLAQGDWLAFIDDDERAPPDWLQQLAATAERFGADGVLAPVLPVLPDHAPAWLRRGRFYHWPRLRTGAVVPPHQLRFGNLLLRGEPLRRLRPLFDPAFGLTGGEDGDLLSRLVLGGARLVWCDRAAVREPVAASRLSLRWLLLRSLRGGQDFARLVLSGRHGPVGRLGRLRLFVRSLAQLLLASLLALLCLPLGRHVAAHWLTKASANLGKLSTFLGLHYREYA